MFLSCPSELESLDTPLATNPKSFNSTPKAVTTTPKEEWRIWEWLSTLLLWSSTFLQRFPLFFGVAFTAGMEKFMHSVM